MPYWIVFNVMYLIANTSDMAYLHLSAFSSCHVMSSVVRSIQLVVVCHHAIDMPYLIRISIYDVYYYLMLLFPCTLWHNSNSNAIALFFKFIYSLFTYSWFLHTPLLLVCVDLHDSFAKFACHIICLPSSLYTITSENFH